MFILIIGQCLYLLWMTAAFFLVTFFTMNLRATLIMPDLEDPIEDHYKDIQYAKVKVALDYGGYISLIKL